MKLYLQEATFVSIICILFVSSVPAQASLVINEIMFNPDAVSDMNGEWMEIYNPGAALDLLNYALADDHGSYTIPSSLVIPAGGYLVFGRNADLAVNGGVPMDLAYGTSLYFGNTGETLSILAPDTSVVNSVDYGAAGFPAVAGASICFTGSGDNVDGANWFAARDLGIAYGAGDFGTPGAANVVPAAVPEPSSLLLIGSGLAGLLRLKRKCLRG